MPRHRIIGRFGEHQLQLSHRGLRRIVVNFRSKLAVLLDFEDLALAARPQTPTQRVDVIVQFAAVSRS
jgi:hypothetical protein